MPRQWDGESSRICPLCGRTFTDGGFVIPTDPEHGDSFTYCRTCQDTNEAAFDRYRGPYLPGRVSCRQRTVFDVITADGPVSAHASGALQRAGRLPAVGDFVVLLRQQEAAAFTIVDILPR